MEVLIEYGWNRPMRRALLRADLYDIVWQTVSQWHVPLSYMLTTSCGTTCCSSTCRRGTKQTGRQMLCWWLADVASCVGTWHIAVVHLWITLGDNLVRTMLHIHTSMACGTRRICKHNDVASKSTLPLGSKLWWCNVIDADVFASAQEFKFSGADQKI